MPSFNHKYDLHQVVKFREEQRPGYAYNGTEPAYLGVIRAVIATPRGPRYEITQDRDTTNVPETSIISVIQEVVMP